MRNGSLCVCRVPVQGALCCVLPAVAVVPVMASFVSMLPQGWGPLHLHVFKYYYNYNH